MEIASEIVRQQHNRNIAAPVESSGFSMPLTTRIKGVLDNLASRIVGNPKDSIWARIGLNNEPATIEILGSDVPETEDNTQKTIRLFTYGDIEDIKTISRVEMPGQVVVLKGLASQDIEEFSQLVYANYSQQKFILDVTVPQYIDHVENPPEHKNGDPEMIPTIELAELDFAVAGINQRIIENIHTNYPDNAEQLIKDFEDGKGIVIIDRDGKKHYIDCYTEQSEHYLAIKNGQIEMVSRLTRCDENNLTPSLKSDAIRYNDPNTRGELIKERVQEFGHFAGKIRAFAPGDILPFLVKAMVVDSKRQGHNSWFATIDAGFYNKLIIGKHGYTTQELGQATHYIGSPSMPIIIDLNNYLPSEYSTDPNHIQTRKMTQAEVIYDQTQDTVEHKPLAFGKMSMIEFAFQTKTYEEWLTRHNEASLSNKDLEALYLLGFEFDPLEECFVRSARPITTEEKVRIDTMNKDRQFSQEEWDNFTGYTGNFGDKSFAVLGCGVAGSSPTRALKQGFARFNNLIFADPEAVDDSNLRHQNYGQAHVGMNKSVAAAQTAIEEYGCLGEIKVFPQGVDNDNLNQIVADSFLIIDGVEATKNIIPTLIHKRAKELRVPVVTAIDVYNTGLLYFSDYRNQQEKPLYFPNALSEDGTQEAIRQQRILDYLERSNQILKNPGMYTNGKSELFRQLEALSGLFNMITVAKPYGPVDIQDLPYETIKAIMNYERPLPGTSGADAITNGFAILMGEFTNGRPVSRKHKFTLTGNGIRKPKNHSENGHYSQDAFQEFMSQHLQQATEIIDYLQRN